MRRPRIHTLEIAESAPAAGAVDSLQRGLELLRCFGPDDDALSVAELARRLGLSRPTTSRLLDTLEQHGFLLHLPGTDKFALHAACLIVGQAVLGSSLLAKAARPLLLPFAERFTVNAMICVQERSDMLVLAQATAQDAPSGALGPGMRVPVTGTALGHAWLWTQPVQVQADWLAGMRSQSVAGVSQAAGVYRAFQELEERGVCQAPDVTRRDVTCFAAPVVLPGGALAVVGCMRADVGGFQRSLLERNCAGALVELASSLRDEAGRRRAQRSGASQA
ncbi:MAG: helix-turn-helix domain-containing protein [Burkholderiales bacterium]|jgi:DNA-binding IclR family transcriptional regulator|nr:helix-turn-helix domain-containing protein [Burkholderiales bacterium]